MSTIDEGELDRLEELYAAATPGKWREGQDGNCRVYGEDGRGEHSGLIASVLKGRPDVSFITEAHNAFPALLAAARALSAEKAEREEAERVNGVWKQNSRETFEALCAMRNDINEHIQLPSLESDLLKGPSMWAFAEAVARAVIAHATTAEAETARLRERVKAAVAEEREACAKIVESYGNIRSPDYGLADYVPNIAAEIRSREKNDAE